MHVANSGEDGLLQIISPLACGDLFLWIEGGVRFQGGDGGETCPRGNRHSEHLSRVERVWRAAARRIAIARATAHESGSAAHWV